MSESDDIFSRWSRRKQAVAADNTVPEPDVPEPAPEPPKTDAEILTEHDLPDPDTMEKGDDFSGFLKESIPDHLRRRALRRLWRSDPIFASLDGLVDYGDDFTDAAMVPDVINTVYRVGKGMLKDIVEEAEDEAAQDAQPKAENPEAQTAQATDPAPKPAETPALAPTTPEPDTPVAPQPLSESEPLPPRPRRMAFDVNPTKTTGLS